ncbi:hypothetical protein POM88_022728 [Heracleum sosnowskyi]|uniref:ARM repeat superfamily protein n=1 Tax=Heracleum sosnowskyi TaxID=360622 RepID=A0AAD8MV33_9APIA|nr:hypothetical protein POM88_022728 [Heracleum sosnowskyi]
MPIYKVHVTKDLKPCILDETWYHLPVKHLPTKRLKKVSATILANIANSGSDFESIPIGPDHQTLVSEDIVHNLLHLISNTGPQIECQLIQVLVAVLSVVSAVKSSGAIISLVQFIEVPQKDLRAASLGGLVKIITENISNTEEQAVAAGLLADLPERDMGLTRQMLDEGAFQLVISRVARIRQGKTRGNRFMTPYLEGLVRVLARITFVLADEPDAVAFCQEHNLASVFTELLQAAGLNNVQMVSAIALENLSHECKNLTRLPESSLPGLCVSIFQCFSKKPVTTGLCRVHRGTCSLKETFCLLEGQALEKLVANFDHTNEKVVEASLAANVNFIGRRT